MTERIPDLNGWFEIPRNPLAKAGVFQYSAKAIQAPGWEANPTLMMNVYRPEAELADPETLASLRLLPWVDGHAMLGDPALQEGLTPPEDKGVHGVIGEQIEYDSADRTLYANIKLWSASLADALALGKKQLSMGFRCVYEFCNGNFEGQPYQAIQRRLRGNHTASVMLGRMGPEIAVLDEFVFTLDAKEIVPMTATVKIKRADLIVKRLGLKDRAALTTYLAALDADEDAPAEGEGGGSVTLEQAVSMIKEIGPQIAEIQKGLAALAATPAADADAEPDGDEMEPVMDAAGKPVMDEAGKPKMQKKIGKKPAIGIAATDAAEMIDKAVAKAVAAVTAKTPTIKTLMAEVAARDALAEKVSGFVGTFDHAEMSLDEVGKYAVSKLAIPNVATGAEVSAVNAYLHGRTPPHKVGGFALDAAGAGAAPAAATKVAEFLAPKAA